MANVIRLDDDTANHNVSKVRGVNDELPSPAEITQVDGNRSDDAAKAFTELLERRSQNIASRVKSIRSYVLENADALSSAVAELRERDQLSATEARETESLIKDIASGKALGGDEGATAGAAGGAPQASTKKRVADSFGG